jgi:translation elongation factor EF-1alpha
MALLVVSAKGKELETALQSGTGRCVLHEHARIACGLGIRAIIVAVTKMGEVKWAKERFDSVCEAVAPILEEAGFSRDCIAYVPVDGLSGEVSPNAKKAPWWHQEAQAQGGGLLEQLVSLVATAHEPNAREDWPLRVLALESSQGPKGAVIVTGRVECGVARTGLPCILAPGAAPCALEAINVDGKAVTRAWPGEAVELQLAGLPKGEAFVAAAGSVVGLASEPIRATSKVKATLDIVQMPRPLTVGFGGVVHVHMATVDGEIASIIDATDVATGEKKEKPKVIKVGQRATVVLKLSQEVAMETNRGRLGCFLFRFEDSTLALGRVLEVAKEA